MKKHLLVASAALCVASAASAQPYPANGYIGVYQDMAGTDCCSDVPSSPPTPTNLFVILHLAGQTAGGITGAEFRLEASAAIAGSAVMSFASAGNVTIGEPLDFTPGADPTPPNSEGTNIGFPALQPGPAVLLGTLNVLVFNPAWPGIDLVTKGRNPPASSDPLFDCPLATLAGPDFIKVCLTIPDGAHGESINFRSGINRGVNCDSACVPVAVATKNWSAVKGLYR